MRLTLTIPIGCLMLCQLLAATPPPCIQGTLASYIALGPTGCTVAGVTFANFSYSPSTAIDIPASKITVSPAATPGSPILTFSADWHVAAGQSQDSVIKYTVTPPAPSNNTPDILRLQLGPATVSGIIGSVTVDESTNVGNLSVFLHCADVCSEKDTDQLKFTPVSVILVTDHVTLSGGNGGASLASFTATFNFCPPCA